MLATTLTIPGYEITGYHGVVIGPSVRGRNFLSDAGAGLKGVVGGEMKGYTLLLESATLDAVERIRENATAAGGNAVIALTFDTGNLADGAHVLAYGTAVTVVPA